MDGDAAGLSFLDAQVRRDLTLIRTDPRLRPTTATRGAALRSHLLDLLDSVEYRLTDTLEETASQQAREAYAHKLRFAVFALRGAHRALPWLAATHRPLLNLGSLYFAEEMARDLIGADVDLIVVPDPDYMYSTVSWPFRKYIARATGFTPKTSRRPIVLNFPLTDADRLLLHPLFAHELGHSSVDAHRLVEAVLSTVKSDPEHHPLRAHAAVELQQAYPSSSLPVLETWLDEQLPSWIEELLCDALALEWCGPAFLLSLVTFLVAHSYNVPSSTHPPNTLRLKFAIDHLRARGWQEYMDRHWPTLLEWIDGIAGDAGTEEYTPTDRYRQELLLRHNDRFQRLAAERLGSSALEAATCAQAAEKTAELLKLGILPVEWDGCYLDRRGILLGGWQAGLAKYSDAPAALVDATADGPLQELLGKALELNVMAQMWVAA